MTHSRSVKSTVPRPRWDGYFADPSILPAGGRYLAFGTDGPDGLINADTGRHFPVLTSTDLRVWDLQGGALNASGIPDSSYCWAPEVAEHEGRFYLYYSAGGRDGEGHDLRVAVSDVPEGPYDDLGVSLFPEEPFSIDAHPFVDPATGERYLFFAKDFFDDPVGTGIAAVRMMDMVTPATEPVPILRATGTWEIFETDRFWYGRRWAAWHTVEGPSVMYRAKKYWLFYSGGRWEADRYGVGVAVADHVLGPYVDPMAAVGPSLLWTGQADLVGPGHCCVFTDDDGRDRIAFHAWHNGQRLMHIADLDFETDQVRVRF